MIHRTIRHMRTRPRDERIAFAGTIALGVMFILLIGWALFFLSTLRTSFPTQPATTATSTLSSF